MGLVLARGIALHLNQLKSVRHRSVVLEDLYAPRGKFEGYCFRDGVTVIVSGFKNGSSLVKSPSEEEIKACLNNPVVQVKRFARIQGTTVGMYKANGGLEDVGTDGKENPNWLQVVRTLSQTGVSLWLSGIFDPGRRRFDPGLPLFPFNSLGIPIKSLPQFCRVNSQEPFPGFQLPEDDFPMAFACRC